MSTHNTEQNLIAERYKKLIDQVDRFRSRYNQLPPETKARYKSDFDTLGTHYDTVKQKYVVFNEAKGADAEKHRHEFDTYLTQTQQHFETVVNSLRSDDSIGWPEGQAAHDPQDSIGWPEGQAATDEQDSKGWPEGQAATREHDSKGWAEGQAEKDQ